MTPPTNHADVWAFSQIRAHQTLPPDRLAQIDEPHRSIAEALNDVAPGDQREAALKLFLAGQDADAWKAMVQSAPPDDPLDPCAPEPPPAIDEPAELEHDYATLADVSRTIGTQRWLWDGWLASGVLNVIASDPGIGKTRFGMDLARRLWFGLDWPDEQPNTMPPRSRTLWVQGDRNFSELVAVARDFGLPEEAVVLGSSVDDPFGSLDLDDDGTRADVGRRIQASGVVAAFIDTVGMCTSRNLCKPEEARAFFAPLIDVAAGTGVPLIGQTHLSSNKEALGRRVVEKARSVIMLTQPDPDGQPNRRRLWVSKSATIKPAALGITMGSSGNTYDNVPPTEPDFVSGRRGPAPAATDKAEAWMSATYGGKEVRVRDVRSAADAEGIKPGTLYNAKDKIGVIEYVVGKAKWWRFP